MAADAVNVVALLTPPGQGAIATLGLAGPSAWGAVRALFRPRSGELPETPQPGRFWLGRCGTELADDVVLAAVRPSCFEIHSHGGRAVVGLLLHLFATRGLMPCRWPEFLRHIGKSPLEVEAAIALTHAATARTAAILLDQYHGALATALTAALAALDGGDLETARRLVARLTGNAPLGRHLTQPWRVVVAGAPNVGKSSLVNALAGYRRSVVSPTPGTTRDVVTTRIAVDGWPVELADTAGQRDAAGDLEGQGIALARAEAAAADLCLWVVDASTPPAWPTERGTNICLVVNKVDLPAAWKPDANVLRVSATTGSGLAELCATLARRLVPSVPPPGAAVPFTPALCAAVEDAERRFATGDLEGVSQLLRAQIV